jgi:hypothetical protein
MMNDETDIGLINTHAKCNSSNNDVNFIIHPILLDLFLISLGYFRMKIRCAESTLVKFFTKLLTLLFGRTIN